jgi:hypothetical protein
MKQRGRKSQESANLLVIDVQKYRLTPPDFLTDKEREIFCSIVDNSEPKAFRRAELPLLSAYVQVLSLSRWYASLVIGGGHTGEAFKRWESPRARRYRWHQAPAGPNEARQEDGRAVR